MRINLILLWALVSVEISEIIGVLVPRLMVGRIMAWREVVLIPRLPPSIFAILFDLARKRFQILRDVLFAVLVFVLHHVSWMLQRHELRSEVVFLVELLQEF